MPSSQRQRASQIVETPDRRLLVGGPFDGQLDLGGGPRASYGKDFYLAKLETDGGHVWSRRFGDPSGQQLVSLGFDPCGAMVLAGTFEGTLDLGMWTTPVTSAGSSDIFVAIAPPDL